MVFYRHCSIVVFKYLIAIFRRGPVIYLDDRLIWLDRRSQPVITSLDGSFPAAMQYRPALGHGNGAFEDGASDSELGHRDFPEALAVATKIRSSKIMVIPKDIKDGEIKVRFLNSTKGPSN